jgi:hypothetical protein
MRGHAVQFHCAAPGVDGLRVDVMSNLRDLPEFEILWQRRTTLDSGGSGHFDLLSVPDLVEAKKTQRSKDWPVIEALVAIHFTENSHDPTPDWIRFWLMEARSPELLVELFARFQKEAFGLQKDRPLLSAGIEGDVPLLRAEIQTEIMREQEKDRLYWEPLKREMEEFRRAARAAPPQKS